MFSFAVKELAWLDMNPVARVRKPSPAPGRVRYLADDERERLLSACRASRNSDLYDVVTLAICTGMRRGEIENLTWDKIDLHRCVITLAPEDVKNATRRVIPLVNPALDIMRERGKLRRLDTNLVFAAPFRRGEEPHAMNFRNAFDYALESAKIHDFKFHDLRHTCASYLAMSGASLTEIGAVLGHKTAQMSMRYAHLSPQHSAAVLNRMAATVFAPQPDREAAE
jgi:integrase